MLLWFPLATQPEAVERLGVVGEEPERTKVMERLRAEVARRGVVDVLRKGVRHGPANLDLFYGRPTPGNQA